jgi:hypothetical protein
MKVDQFQGLNDAIKGLSSVTYGGTLIVTDVGGTPFDTSFNYKFYFATNYSGSFAAIIPFVPGPGLIWKTNLLGTSGTLQVTTVSKTRPVLATSISGNNLTLSWPADHAGWRLQAQTNALNVGFTNNWVTVPNSTNFLSYMAQIVKTNPTVFYRLVYP